MIDNNSGKKQCMV